ncbi:sigma-70 family RNA polymerase sigma factor [Solidesulfovibrio sp.]|uniref:sigma-70 family RNA polymerase sigma factor n=1 Tax=Solidesulfovibrio sp. TaxID=2910990 RepID=UPI00263923CB|nr:sigma-70 family RNA polymerase sigma factor [Solidesulfovibrio sp.]
MDKDISLLMAEIPHLRRYARALARDPQTAEDLVQSCLERALRRFHQWQRDRRLRPWLLAIMHNLHVSAIRQRAGEPASVPLHETMAAATAGDQESRFDAKRVLEAARELPEDQRLAVLLVGVEEMSYKDAAEMLGIPVGTLMSRLHRGREQLRRLLGLTKVVPLPQRAK